MGGQGRRKNEIQLVQISINCCFLLLSSSIFSSQLKNLELRMINDNMLTQKIHLFFIFGTLVSPSVCKFLESGKNVNSELAFSYVRQQNQNDRKHITLSIDISINSFAISSCLIRMAS